MGRSSTLNTAIQVYSKIVLHATRNLGCLFVFSSLGDFRCYANKINSTGLVWADALQASPIQLHDA